MCARNRTLSRPANGKGQDDKGLPSSGSLDDIDSGDLQRLRERGHRGDQTNDQVGCAKQQGERHQKRPAGKRDQRLSIDAVEHHHVQAALQLGFGHGRLRLKPTRQCLFHSSITGEATGRFLRKKGSCQRLFRTEARGTCFAILNITELRRGTTGVFPGRCVTCGDVERKNASARDQNERWETGEDGCAQYRSF